MVGGSGGTIDHSGGTGDGPGGMHGPGDALLRWASMDTPQHAKEPFFAGLPDGPVELPSGWLDPDGPLVCPFYGPNHPARRDEESKEAFNEHIARAAFGREMIEMLTKRQGRVIFRGDWWLLGRLWHAIITAGASDEIHTAAFDSLATDHEKMLRSGVQAHLEAVNLVNLRLEHARLRSAHLEHARLGGSHLEHANLSDAHLEHADLCESNLQHAILMEAQLVHADLSYCKLQHAQLVGANMNHANLMEAHFEHAGLNGVVLNNAALGGAFLDDAYLENASLHHAWLEWANLDRACLRGAQGLLFNENAVQRLDIEGNAPDPWSTLRRTYTGPMFFVHLLLLVAFLLPYAARVLTLTTTARGYEALRESLDAGEGVPPGGEVVRAWLAHFDASHTQTHAAWVLLGGTHAWWWAMVPTALAILCYNVLRGHLTLTIGVLRDQADRVERTPTLVEYYGHCHPLAGDDAGVRRIPAVWWRRAKDLWTRKPFLRGGVLYERLEINRWKHKDLLNPLPIIGPWYLHQLARVLFWISIASVALHVGWWLWDTTVPMPN
jgi:uncharacterized protein YjbI with pentapeptide repeats